MRIFIFIAWILAGAFTIWLQFRYKDANYPNSWQWRARLFCSGGVTGVLGSFAFLFHADFRLLLITVIYSFLFLGLLFAFASPHSMKGIYPKRPENEQGGDGE